MIQSISHITLIVSNLEKSTKLFKDLFDAKEVYSSTKDDNITPTKFFLIADIWFALIEGETHQDKTYDHIALKINEKDIAKYQAKIKELNLETKDGRKRNENEPQSLYFYDYDNHLFELHTGTLEDRLNKQ